MQLNMMDYADLQIGETRSGECPACGRKKFYVTRKPQGYAYICFRASCSTQGFYGSDSFQYVAEAPKKPFRRYAGGMSMPTYEDLDYFQQRFGIFLDSPTDAMQYFKRTEDGRYAFIINGVREEYRGVAVRRALWGGTIAPPISDNYSEDYPKSLTYWEPEARRCGWYHSMRERTLVVVEDPVSAMRIMNMGHTAICLFGTNFHDDVISDIVQFKKAEEVIIALDPDAAIKALGIAIRWGGMLPRCRTAMLQRDPKDYYLDTELLEDLGLLK